MWQYFNIFISVLITHKHAEPGDLKKKKTHSETEALNCYICLWIHDTVREKCVNQAMKAWLAQSTSV